MRTFGIVSIISLFLRFPGMLVRLLGVALWMRACARQPQVEGSNAGMHFCH